jgi:uncharacterized membrane-anchored protein YitT (DUF2179 family)
MKKNLYNGLMVNVKDYIMITLGLALYAVGFTIFILPHHIVIGGFTGLGTLVNFATRGLIPVAVTIYTLNVLLLICGFKLLGKQFVLRTIFGATLAALSIGCLEGYFTSHPPIMEDVGMSVILGGILCGMGIGMVFVHNGSSGGTDIVAALVNRVSNVSIGRTMMITDMIIVASSLLLPFEGDFEARVQARVPMMIYGWIVTCIISYMTDQLINTNRQAKQFMIISDHWKDIATAVNNDAHRGVTVMDGEGWYSHQDVKILLVWCRKIESVTIFRIVKSIDPLAIITQSNVSGVYGKGFDQMRVKLKRKRDIDNARKKEEDNIQITKNTK